MELDESTCFCRKGTRLGRKQSFEKKAMDRGGDLRWHDFFDFDLGKHGKDRSMALGCFSDLPSRHHGSDHRIFVQSRLSLF